MRISCSWIKRVARSPRICRFCRKVILHPKRTRKCANNTVWACSSDASKTYNCCKRNTRGCFSYLCNLRVSRAHSATSKPKWSMFSSMMPRGRLITLLRATLSMRCLRSILMHKGLSCRLRGWVAGSISSEPGKYTLKLWIISWLCALVAALWPLTSSYTLMASRNWIRLGGWRLPSFQRCIRLPSRRGLAKGPSLRLRPATLSGWINRRGSSRQAGAHRRKRAARRQCRACSTRRRTGTSSCEALQFT